MTKAYPSSLFHCYQDPNFRATARTYSFSNP
jgi:hypothetical protein